MTNNPLALSLILGITLMLISILLAFFKRLRSSSGAISDAQAFLMQIDQKKTDFESLIREAEEYSNDLKRKMFDIRNLEETSKKIKEELTQSHEILLKSLENLRPVLNTFLKSVKVLESELINANRNLTSKNPKFLSTNSTTKPKSNTTESRRTSSSSSDSQFFDIVMEKLSKQDEMRKDPRLGVLGIR